MKRPTIALLAAAAVVCVACSDTLTVEPPKAPAPVLSTTGVVVGTETRITTDPAAQSMPAISGDRIVWRDTRNGNNDVYMYDLATRTESRVTTDPGQQNYPRISGDRIVWYCAGCGDDLWNTYVYDLATQTQSRINTRDGCEWHAWPAISGDRIVWNGFTELGPCAILLYDVRTRTETQITTDQYNQSSPAISGDRIVWQDGRNGAPDIYMYDLATQTETQITTDQYYQSRPAISGDRIVWQDGRNGASDIYMYDLATQTESRITTDPADQGIAAISGDRIVWQDYRNGASDIYMYDLATRTESRITTDPAMQVFPEISGDRIVWQDYRNGNWDIYLYEVSAILLACHQPLWALLDQFIADGSIRNRGIGEALQAFLRQLGAACERGDAAAAQRILEHIISFVGGQSGRGISPEAAQALTNAARTIISNGCCCS